MTIYGKRVLEAIDECARLDKPSTMEELEAITGFDRRYIFQGIWDARSKHLVIAVPHNGPTTFTHPEGCCDVVTG